MPLSSNITLSESNYLFLMNQPIPKTKKELNVETEGPEKERLKDKFLCVHGVEPLFDFASLKLIGL